MSEDTAALACPAVVSCVCRDTANNDRLRDLLEALDGQVTARPETPAQVWAETMRRIAALAQRLAEAEAGVRQAKNHLHRDHDEMDALEARATRAEEALRDVLEVAPQGHHLAASDEEWLRRLRVANAIVWPAPTEEPEP